MHFKLQCNHNQTITGNTTVGGTLGVTGASTLTGATTATGGITIPASTTVGLNFGSGTDRQLAMQSGVSDRIALRTTHTSTGDNNPLIIYQPSGAGAQNDALVVNTGGQVTKSKNPAFLTYGSPTMSSSILVLVTFITSVTEVLIMEVTTIILLVHSYTCNFINISFDYR